MSYVAIYPLSNGNPSKKYRVADSESWTKFLDGEVDKYNFTEHETFEEAVRVRDEKNAKGTNAKS